MKKFNPAMLCDYYEYTMANGYHLAGVRDEIVYFDMFFRDIPDHGGFAIAAGLDSFIEWIKNFHFESEDITFLRGQNIFDEEWLKSLGDFRFTGDIWAVPEGTVVFPDEPLVTVRAPAGQAQLIETGLLLCLNHQSLIATKANRIVRAAEGRAVMEFGARRAQGAEAAILGARAAYLAGCAGTSNTVCGQLYGIPALGTMAHSWIQIFNDEYTAFRRFCELYPSGPSLLVDTYNVLHSGVPNAIRVFKEMGIPNGSIRLDSGDITYLSIKARAMLDEAGLPGCCIMASNSLDEQIIREVIRAGARVDAFGVGERLITAQSDPIFGGIYKLAAVEKDGGIIPKIKLSENPHKITTPHFKRIYRLYERETGKAIADYICLRDEQLRDDQPLELFDPHFTWKRKTVSDYIARELQQPIFRAGELVYRRPGIEDIKAYCQSEVDSLWDEVKRFENPHHYYVDLSQRLWDTRQALIEKGGRQS